MIALVPRHGIKNPIFGVLAHGLFIMAEPGRLRIECANDILLKMI